MGTGCNGAYIERIDNIEKWKGDASAKEMIINMEFGAFDKEREILPLTMFDNKMDRKSVVSPSFIPHVLLCFQHDNWSLIIDVAFICI